ncbi:ABC transporter permease [Nocardioides campestrisoli]|uniref:ABC transporter permease n=1 Tax=Nocardioides campestrisoli TaxID=2736757 RepID=UPI00281203BD|nr:ABC transporter permease [Nocardioides campestrisoli]
MTRSLDLSPAPGSASLAAQVMAQARMEFRLILRNGEQLLLALVIPVIVLVGGVAAADRVGLDFDRPVIDVLAPGVLALAVMSTAFTSVAIATGFERRYGLIKRLGTSPLPRHGLLLGKAGAVLLVELLQILVLGAVAALLGWEPEASGWPAAVLVLLLGTTAFTSLGLLIAGTLRAEATLAAANLVYLLLLAGGAVVVPADSYGAFADVAAWLPSGALGEGMRAALIDGRLDGGCVLILLGWSVVGATATARTFTWE